MLHQLVFCGGIIFLLASGGVVLAEGTEPQKQSQPTTAVTEVSPSSSKTASININTVEVAVLQKAKGMSKKKAQAIVDYRTKNGPFKSLDDLLKVKCRGIHKNWLDKVSKYLSL